jgi:hypothetical protein
LRAIQEPMIGLLAQDHHLLNQLVFLLTQGVFSDESLSQLDFGVPTPNQLAFVTLNRATGLMVVN